LSSAIDLLGVAVAQAQAAPVAGVAVPVSHDVTQVSAARFKCLPVQATATHESPSSEKTKLAAHTATPVVHTAFDGQAVKQVFAAGA